jgi:hypothetical protein
MTADTNRDTENSAATSSTIDGRYFAIVGLLLIAIIATLGVLWIRERRVRLAAQAQNSQLQEQVKALQQAFTQQQLQGLIFPIMPEDMTVEPAEAGQPRRIRIPLEAAMRIGPFQPGDVIHIDPPSEPTGSPPAGP